ncbi:MAG: hypothetical protein SPLM_09040 [Spiroplasma phoeniceum]
MKKLNKTCLKQRYWGYCFHKECSKENNLNLIVIVALQSIDIVA